MVLFQDILARVRAYVTLRNLILLFIALAVIGVGVIFLRGRASDVETITVHPKEFIQQVSVSGTVVAAEEVDLGFTASGRVARTYARVGDAVRAGAILAEMDNSEMRATVSQREAALASQQAKLDSLKTGTRPEEISIARSSVESARVSLAQAHEGVINAVRDAYTDAETSVRGTVDQFINSPRSALPSLSFSTSASQLAVDIPARRVTMEDVLNRWQARNLGLSTSSDVLAAAQEAQHDLSMTALLLSDSASALSQAQTSQTVSASDIASYVSDVTAARATINITSAALTSAVTTYRAATATLDQAQKNLTLKEAGPTKEDIAAQVAQVAAARADVDNARAQLSKTLIAAPFSGTVTRMDAKEGEIVSPNTPEISLMSVDRLHVESYVPEISVALVRPLNEAVVTLDAYGVQVMFKATVVSVDPAETIRNGVPMYRAILEFSEQDLRIKSGMTANVSITTARRENIISVPQGIITIRSGKGYVLIRNREQFEEREVTTGAVSAIGEIEILSGLSDGDIVVLTPGS